MNTNALNLWTFCLVILAAVFIVPTYGISGYSPLKASNDAFSRSVSVPLLEQPSLSLPAELVSALREKGVVELGVLPLSEHSFLRIVNGKPTTLSAKYVYGLKEMYQVRVSEKEAKIFVREDGFNYYGTELLNFSIARDVKAFLANSSPAPRN